MQKITPFLWFNNQAEEAVTFYTSLFKNSKTGAVTHYDEASAKVSGQPEGSVLTVGFTLCGKEFAALNGGPQFTFTPAISFFVSCETETEIDTLWEKLSQDAKRILFEYGKQPFAEKYGWLDDKYGVSWQLMLRKEQKQNISPAFLFVGKHYGQAQEAMTFYTSVFPNSHINFMQQRKEDTNGEKKGTVEYASFTIAGEPFNAMEGNGNHKFDFSLATSFVINCETQEEVDTYWNKLSAVKEAEQCGWLQDKYGISWQVVPTMLDKMLTDKDKAKAGRTMKAMLQMKKLDIAKLKAAYDGK